MGQVTVTLNNRTYRLSCGAGEEVRLRELADHLGLRVDRLAMDFGQHGDERLLVMAALLATDELLDAKVRIATLEASLAKPATDAQASIQPDAGGPIEPEPTDPDAAVLDALPAVEFSASAIPARNSPDPAPVAKSAPTRNTLEARLAEAKAAAKPATAPAKAGPA